MTGDVGAIGAPCTPPCRITNRDSRFAQNDVTVVIHIRRVCMRVVCMRVYMRSLHGDVTLKSYIHGVTSLSDLCGEHTSLKGAPTYTSLKGTFMASPPYQTCV
jgi:hypothetical protein